MNLKTLFLTAALALTTALSMHAAPSFYEITAKDIAGKDTSLSAYRGKVVLVVNVASKCGNTKQYTGLETIYTKYKPQGLEILGFPCNQFGGQEPGTSEDIQAFCSTKYNVTFPLFEKVEVNGAGRHPLYTFLSGDDAAFPGKIGWNFGKFLVGRDGKVIARFEPKTQPESPEVVAAIEAALAQK